VLAVVAVATVAFLLIALYDGDRSGCRRAAAALLLL
jgi:hypothetical protein